MPGPTGTLGLDRMPYAQSIEDEDDAQDAGPRHRRGRAGRRVVRAAVGFIGAKRLVVRGEKQRYDCSGFVCAAHKQAGHPLRGNTRSLQELAKAEDVFHKRKRPTLGDVVFFHNTYDRNRNGKRDDLWSHIAIVETVDADGTITMVHKGGKGVTRITMNLKRPHLRKDGDGKRLNSYLTNHKHGAKLAGELWSGFGSLWTLQDRRVAQN